ncbi:MAG: glycine cleavage system protein [Thermotogaceae bacterium]|jgi:glycine cleavage system H protein|nr:glycine cleavage system protein [Thermotogaceae bacterium]MDN5336992.1 glycine cleavage system protein [Thermotogaceae bacterium]
MKKYSKTHEWVEVDGKIATIGISNHAQEELGDVVFVELPEIGKEVKKGEVLCSVESVKAASDIYAPLTGKVIEVNTELDTTPEIINQDAEGKGWIAKLEFTDESELDDLMSEEEYKKFVEQH